MGYDMGRGDAVNSIFSVDFGHERSGYAVSVRGRLVSVGLARNAELPDIGAGASLWVLERCTHRVREEGMRRSIDKLREVEEWLADQAPKAYRPNPSQWKGNIPKDAHHRILKGLLYKDERRLFSGLHLSAKHMTDLYDAAGLNIWAMGRWPRYGGPILRPCRFK